MNGVERVKRLISLVLVLTLVFSILAIPAQASALTGLLIGVRALTVVAASLIGLGISPGSDGSVFDGIVSDAVAHLQSLGFGDGVTIPVLKYIGTGGGIRYALQSAAMIALRSWIFSEGVVSSSSVPSWPTSRSYIFRSLPTSFYTQSSFPLFVFYYFDTSSNSYEFCVFYLNPAIAGDKFFYKSSSYSDFFTFSELVDSLPGGYILGGSFSCDESYFDGSTVPYFGAFSGNFSSNKSTFLSIALSYVDSSYDVSLGDVASEDTELSVGYPNWAIDSVQIDPDPNDPDDEPDLFIPVTLLPTYDETKAQTQDQAQTGDSSLETDNDGTSVDISGDVGGSITPGGGAGDLPSSGEAPTVDDLTTMFAWLASSIDRSVELLFPDLQVIKTYLKTIAQWHETENVKYDSIISYLSGFDTDIDSMMTSLSNIDLDMDTLLLHASSSAGSLASIAADVADIRDVIADPLDADINEQEQDNKNAFLNTFSKKSQAKNITDLSGFSDGFSDWFELPDVSIGGFFDQLETGVNPWFTSETQQAISLGGGPISSGAALMSEDPPATPYLDAWDQEVQSILNGGHDDG